MTMGKGTNRFKALAGKQGKVVFARLLPGCDLMQGIEKVCKDNEIEAGSIACIGSLREAVLQNPSPMEGDKINPHHGTALQVPGPLQILCCLGTIYKSEQGETKVHIHGVVCNDKHELHGGDFVKGENIVSVTVELVVNEVQDIRIMSRYDPEVEQKHLYPEKRGSEK